MRQIPIAYHSRTTKAAACAAAFDPFLGKTVLDVGADQRQLQEHLRSGTTYVGVGWGDVDLELDLETARLPYTDRSHETVLCLDVLEHLEHAHLMFDELCRVADKHVIISLPNPLAELLFGLFRPSAPTGKFYGLPAVRPTDRHRWFFSITEARQFITERARMNGFSVVAEATRLDRRRFWLGAPLLLPLTWRSLSSDDLKVATLFAILKRNDG